MASFRFSSSEYLFTLKNVRSLLSSGLVALGSAVMESAKFAAPVKASMAKPGPLADSGEASGSSSLRSLELQRN